MTRQFLTSTVHLVFFTSLAGCGSDVDEAGAQALWQKLQEAEYADPEGSGGYTRLPGYETPQSTIREHGGTAIVYINPIMSSALAAPGMTLPEWPEGALLVKDSFDGESPTLVAAMEKRASGWYWAEWTADGEVKYAGHDVDVCVNCHAGGDDYVLTTSLEGGQ